MPMKVFLSWSEDWSELVAKELARCLTIVLRVKPFLSSKDLRSGSQWYEEIARALGKTKFGIVCLTPENLEAPWILFEGGAIAKTSAEVQSELTTQGKAARKSYLCPYLIGGLKPAQIKAPFSHYYCRESSREDTLALFMDINSVLREVEGPDAALSDKDLTDTFDKLWPDLKKVLDNPPGAAKPKERSLEDYLEEILGLVRVLARSQPSRVAFFGEGKTEVALLNYALRNMQRTTAQQLDELPIFEREGLRNIIMHLIDKDFRTINKTSDESSPPTEPETKSADSKPDKPTPKKSG